MVFGLQSRRIQACLLETKDLTFKKALEVATAMELTDKDVTQLQSGTAAVDYVNSKVATTPKKGKTTGNKKPSNAKYKRPNSNSKTSNNNTVCFRCGGNHLAPKCTRTLSKNVDCRHCGIKGHLQKVCMKKEKEQTNQLDEILQIQGEQTKYREKFYTMLWINNRKVSFEVDSGAAVTVVSQDFLQSLLPNIQLMKSDLQLVTYCKTVITVIGYARVNVRYRQVTKTLNIYVSKTRKEPLMGREWIRQLNVQLLDSLLALSLSTERELQTILQKYEAALDPTSAKIREIQARLTLKKNTSPIFLKSRKMPFNLMPLVDKEIDKLITTGTLEKVNTSTWATPVVPVLKRNNTIRLCGDFSVTLNKHLVVDEHPLPTIDELFSTLAGGEKFSKIDLKQAYLQMEIHPSDREMLTFSTHRGLYKNDIRITGPNDRVHLQRLEEVLTRLGKYNIKINSEESEFMKDGIHYCGYYINKNTCETAFIAAKKAFTNNEILAHYNSKLSLIVACDASSYGVGAVLSQQYLEGNERVIQYASQSLSQTQRKYAQVDKEAYAIIFAIKKFHQYLYGSKFTLYTDHRPLTQIFAPEKGLPAHSAMRMQHYAIFLQGFKYDIKYKDMKSHANADALSRLPMKPEDTYTRDVVDDYEIKMIELLPITFKDLMLETARDIGLRNLLQGLQHSTTLKAEDRFNIPQTEFSCQQGVILRDKRVVIPKKLRSAILRELHSDHPGIVKIKSIARRYCWWPGIDHDLETVVRNCASCNAVRKEPTKVEGQSWEEAERPFQRVHIDFAGPFKGQYFFVLVDAFSKWPEVHVTKDMTTQSVIQKCKQIFATFGIPEIIVSYNGRHFKSYEFAQFLKRNGIIHKTSAPFHPATNGQAERFIQTFKLALKKQFQDTLPTRRELIEALRRFLLHYCRIRGAGAPRRIADRAACCSRAATKRYDCAHAKKRLAKGAKI
ncbi:PREDICTED: uncharacterized protein K02A2.6-like [Vollenhovia emeryi]|uniref:uncharacterized protein K02A2.6-like n=1 Tax=Vollenhovia emeryi TaxID=411798 RepID=UPI0005F5799B|nr:PREDICTED: uncharacterized protein K02A2.6-like [Vollenhovia emeryi]